MRLKDILEAEISRGKYKRENEIKIIESDQDIDMTRYCTARRDDILCYVCFDASSIRRDASNRQTVADYLETRFPGFDSSDFYIDNLIELCDNLGIGKIDLVADKLLSDKRLDAIVLYEKKGHYFTSYDGDGYDITSFVDANLLNMIGIRDGKKGCYRLYIIFMDGGKNGK